MTTRPYVLVSCFAFLLVAASMSWSAPALRAAASVPYVIVTDAALAPAFAPLAAAHTAAGLTTEVHTVQDIVAAYPAAADDAERIRMFLIDAHATLGTRFALLGGDDPLVPMRRAYLRLSQSLGGSDLLLPTDQYYACLAGTWNADGDANWGELAYPGLGEPGDDVSFLPDLAVGRAPVTTLAQAQVFVAKSLAALAAQGVSPPPSVLLVSNAFFAGTPEELDNAGFMEQLLPILALRAGTHVARLYQLSANWPGSFPETRASLLDSLNRGYDAAILNGQGGPGLFQAGNYPADLVTAADLGALTNSTPTFALLISSFATQPGPGSIGAAWMNDAAGGATSVLAPSDIEFLAAGENFAREFVHQALELHVPTQGEALAAAITALSASPPGELMRLTTQGNVLLGDPALAWPGTLEGAPTPTLLSLVDSAAEGGVARLSWYASGASAAGALVQRRSDGTDWAALGPPTGAGEGLLSYEDHVDAGGRFAYRLRLATGEVSTETWLTIPGIAVLRLAGFAPNPSLGPLRVAFALPSSAPATLAVVSPGGRLVARQDVGALGPGAHVVELAGGSRLAPGVYWIRLAQGGRVLVARGVRLR